MLRLCRSRKEGTPGFAGRAFFVHHFAASTFKVQEGEHGVLLFAGENHRLAQSAAPVLRMDVDPDDAVLVAALHVGRGDLAAPGLEAAPGLQAHPVVCQDELMAVGQSSCEDAGAADGAHEDARQAFGGNAHQAQQRKPGQGIGQHAAVAPEDQRAVSPVGEPGLLEQHQIAEVYRDDCYHEQ